MEFKKLN